MGVATIHAFSRLATDTTALTRWYTKTVGTAIHLEITPTRYPASTSAIERVHALAKRTSPQIAERESDAVLDTATRPTTSILRDRMARTYLANPPSDVQRKRKPHSRKSRSPRSMVTFSGTSHTGAHSASDTPQSSKFEPCLTDNKPPPTIVQVIPGPGNDGEFSVFTREQPPTRLCSKDTFGESVESSVLTLSNEFRETSMLLTGVRESQIPDDMITLLVIESVTTRPKLIASTKLIIRLVIVLLQFYLDTRNETSATLTGGSSMVLIRDYLESLAERGRTVASSGKHAPAVWSEALGIDWPLTNPLALSAGVVESNEEPKQAPSMSLDAVKAIDALPQTQKLAPTNEASRPEPSS